MLLLKYNILSYKDSDSGRIYSQYINENMYLSYVLLYIFFSLFLAYYLNTLLTSCKWFISHCVFHNILFHGRGPVLMIMASANSSRKKRVGLADSQDNVNVGR